MTTARRVSALAHRALPGSALLAAALSGALALVAASAALAQTPDRSNDYYQDWLLNCAVQRTGDMAVPPKAPEAGAKPSAAKEAPKPNTVCEMVQTFRNRTNNQVIAIVALGKPEPGAERKFVIQVPVGVWLPDGVSLTTEAKATVAGQYLRCSSTVCIAQADAKKEVIDALKAGAVTSLEFSDAGRTRAKLTISGKGFGDALAALDKRG